jgi:acetyltransferase-like isoleucine patch superfamily enzyme
MEINMSVFEELQNGIPYDVRDPKYQEEVHGEIDRCDHICWQIRQTDPADKLKLKELEDELFNGIQGEGTYLTPPFFIDCASQVKLGKNVYINHNADMMALGGISIDDGVMIGPECAILTVNHEPKNIRIVMTKAVCIKKNAWLGARVSVLPGVTIGENAIVGTGSVVTKDIPDNCIAVGNPARVIRQIE